MASPVRRQFRLAPCETRSNGRRRVSFRNGCPPLRVQRRGQPSNMGSRAEGRDASSRRTTGSSSPCGSRSRVASANAILGATPNNHHEPAEVAMTGRRAVVSMITTMSILLLSAPLGAQVSLRDRDPNPALRQGTIDPAALGLGGRGFLEFSEGEQFDWMAAAGLGLFGGTLRASYGYEQNFSQRIYGLGYARAITQTDMGLFGTLGTGVDLSAAYSSSRYLSHYAPR